jgi:hypothetical protein
MTLPIELVEAPMIAVATVRPRGLHTTVVYFCT